jgi:hypothetical protein
MATLRPASSSSAGTGLDTKTALLALMICELCLNEFCVFPKQSADGGAQTEIGLLHCGEGSGCFLIIDLAERSFRLVACRLASMQPNAAEPRKFDLVVMRAGEEEEEEELFKVEAAPRDVAAFWLRYAMPDI